MTDINYKPWYISYVEDGEYRQPVTEWFAYPHTCQQAYEFIKERTELGEFDMVAWGHVQEGVYRDIVFYVDEYEGEE